MVFTLEALQAQEGDCLILHYGQATCPRFILVDGGPTGTLAGSLEPRLDQLKTRWCPSDALPLDLVIVSHVDGDHIQGVLELTDRLVGAAPAGQTAPYEILTLWHNCFDDILGNAGEIHSFLSASLKPAAAGARIPLMNMAQPDLSVVLADIGEGRRLRDDAERLGITPLNEPFEGLVMAKPKGPTAVSISQGVTLTVLVPNKTRMEKLQAKWDDALRKAKAKGDKSVLEAVAASKDGSPTNLSSIAVLAECQGKRMLLTGDARGDDLLKGLVAAGLAKKGQPFPVDILKLPHHGSNRNVTPDFFRLVPATHYLISANGKHDNPDIDTLEMITAARTDDDFTLHFTNRDGENDLGTRLKAFVAAQRKAKRKFKVAYLGDAGPTIKLDLLDPVTY